MTYRNAKRTVEDCLISELYLEVIRQWEGKYKNTDSFKKAKSLLEQDLKSLCGLDTKVVKRLKKEAGNVFEHFVDNKFDTRKCFITIANMGAALNDNELAELPSGVIEVIQDTNNIVEQAFNDPDADLTQEDIVKIYRSCEKHATKLIAKLQKDGYY
jgi:hypothetical protein